MPITTYYVTNGFGSGVALDGLSVLPALNRPIHYPMSFHAQNPPSRHGQSSGTRWVNLTVFGLVAVIASWCMMQVVTAPPSVPYQVYDALGCRATADVLILTLRPDGKVIWPDNSICTVEESVLLLPGWCAKKEEPVLAVLANADALFASATPLLEAASKLEIRRAILSTPLNYKIH